MQRHWDTLLEREQEGFKVIIDKTWEDVHPSDCFDDTAYDIREMCDKIDRGEAAILRGPDGDALHARWAIAGVHLLTGAIHDA